MKRLNLRTLLVLLIGFALLLCGCAADELVPPVSKSTEQQTTAVTEPSPETAAHETVAPETVAAETAAPKPPRAPSDVVVQESDIPAFRGGTGSKIYDCGDGALMRYVSGVLSSEYTRYLDDVEDAGYTQIGSEVLGENRFAHFQKGELSLYAYYIPADTAVRIIAEPVTVCVPSDQEQEAVAEPCITQIETNFSTKLNGMSYLLRCASGDFIVIDGGWKGEGEADKLYALMREQQIPAGTSEMPRIAAWIITHPHSDHIGAIDEFGLLYGNRVVLERIVYNFVCDAVMAGSDAKDMLEVGGAVRNLRNRLNNGCWSDTVIIKPHTGQLLEIDDAKLRIWSTHEDIYPDTEALASMNATSLTFTVTLGDSDFLVLGDATNTVTAKMAARYGNLLACDILQPTHHGTTGGREDLYAFCAPSICLWPTTTQRLDEYREKAYNQYLLNNVAEHYISGDGTVTLTLPRRK